MTLPGKITFCQLEEDIPSKSYFRIRPLLVCEEDGFKPYENAEENFPDEGGIRIVPDKYEALHFKTRMRTLGGYCLLDLTRHTGENDKIRPNKNYSPEKNELNRNIVYSDVVMGCPENSVMQVLVPTVNEDDVCVYPGEETLLTPRVVLEIGGKFKGPFNPRRENEMDNWSFVPAGEAPADLNGENLTTFSVGGKQVRLLIDFEALKPKKAPEAPAAEKSAEAPVKKVEPAPAAPVSPAPKAEEPAPAPVPATPAAPAAAAIDEQQAEQLKTEIKSEVRDVVAKALEENRRAARAERIAEKAAEKAEKPAEKRPRAADNQWMGQLGLNPRKGKSLSEIVDSEWRRSRIESLGVTVEAETAAAPVISPIERAMNAVKEVWNIEEGRAGLIEQLVQLEQLPEAVSKTGSAPAKRDENMDELEAERLSLMREIDQLKLDRQEKRGELMAEAMAAHEKELKALEERKTKLNEECESSRRAAQSAKDAYAKAQELLNTQNREKLDSEFLRFAMFTKAAQLLQSESGKDVTGFTGAPETYSPTGAQLVSDLRRAFESIGREVDHDEALNLLTCLALGKAVILSGPTGCGKTYLADFLAGALGLNNPACRRYARIGSNVKNAAADVEFKALSRLNDGLTQRFVLLDDVNAEPNTDQARGLMPLIDSDQDSPITPILTVLDDQIGYPLDSRLLDRAFFIRIKAPALTRWQRAPKKPANLKAPSLKAVTAIFNPETDVPGEVTARLNTFEKKLEEMGVTISMRALGDMYAYCAAMIPLMTGSPMQALDRAIAQRALPHLLATCSEDVVAKLPELLIDMPISLSLLNEPLPLPPM